MWHQTVVQMEFQEQHMASQVTLVRGILRKLLLRNEALAYSAWRSWVSEEGRKEEVFNLQRVQMRRAIFRMIRSQTVWAWRAWESHLHMSRQDAASDMRNQKLMRKVILKITVQKQLVGFDQWRAQMERIFLYEDQKHGQQQQVT